MRIVILALVILYAPSACAGCLPFAKAKETFNPPYHYKVDGRHRCWYGKLRKVVMQPERSNASGLREITETPPLPAPVTPEGAKVVNLGDRFTDSLGRPVDVSAVIAERFFDPVPPVQPPEPEQHVPLWVWIGLGLIGFGSVLLAAMPMRRDKWAPTRALPMGEDQWADEPRVLPWFLTREWRVMRGR